MDSKNKLKISLLNFDVLKKILRHILLCKLSYKTPQELIELFNETDEYNKIKPILNYQQYYDNNTTDCQAYSWKNNDTLYVIFRGTSSLKDALVDLNFSLKCFENYTGTYVHRGFYNQFNSVKEGILKNIDDSVSKISVSGHSLGGGIACIASTYFAINFPNKEVSCFTYGCPRPGNIMFKKLFQKNVKKYYRIVMNDDPITMIPSNCLYQHVCKAINIKDTLQVTYLSEIPWYKRSFYICGNIKLTHLFDAHHTYVYQEKIEELFNTEENEYIDGNTRALSNNNEISIISNNNTALMFNNAILQNNLANGIYDYKYNSYILNCNNQILNNNNLILQNKMVLTSSII